MSDQQSTRGDRKPDEPLPGSVSDQNAEEAEPGHGGGTEHRKSPSGAGDGGSSSGNSGDGGSSSGNSGEGSQSTGSPDSAG